MDHNIVQHHPFANTKPGVESGSVNGDGNDFVSPSENELFYEGLLRSMEDIFRMNQRILFNREALEKDRLEEEKKRKKDAREKVRKLLLSYEKDSHKIPFWRHKLKGNSNPPEFLVLKGVKLLRVIIKALLLYCIRPYLFVMRRKRATRIAEREFLDRTLNAYAVSSDHYISRTIRIPLISVSNDDAVDFDFKAKSRFDFQNSVNKKKVIQLKVRVRNLIESIVASECPHDLVANLLVVMIDDGIYFRQSYLFECEKLLLDFDDLGAAFNTCPVIDKSIAMEEMSQNKNVYKIANRFVDITRSKMIIQNFLLIR